MQASQVWGELQSCGCSRRLGLQLANVLAQLRVRGWAYNGMYCTCCVQYTTMSSAVESADDAIRRGRTAGTSACESLPSSTPPNTPPTPHLIAPVSVW